MWLAQQFCPAGKAMPSGFGDITIPAQTAAAMTGEQEQRLLPIISPGGYVWAPAVGQRVFVLREGSPCILGVHPPEQTLSPGEVLIYSGSASIKLSPDGKIHLTGQVYLNDAPMGGK